jgi:hypothetical protein
MNEETEPLVKSLVQHRPRESLVDKATRLCIELLLREAKKRDEAKQ